MTRLVSDRGQLLRVRPDNQNPPPPSLQKKKHPFRRSTRSKPTNKKQALFIVAPLAASTLPDSFLYFSPQNNCLEIASRRDCIKNESKQQQQQLLSHRLLLRYWAAAAAASCEAATERFLSLSVSSAVRIAFI